MLPVSTDHVVYGFHITIPHLFWFSHTVQKNSPLFCCHAYSNSNILPQPPLKILVDKLSALVKTTFYFNYLELLHEKMGD